MDREMSDEYRDYMKSRAWKNKRAFALYRAENRCEECGIEKSEEDPLDVHHLTYVRFQREWEEDLQVLCRLCHDRKEIAKRRRGYPEGKLTDLNEALSEYFLNVLVPRVDARVGYVEEPVDACPF